MQKLMNSNIAELIVKTLVAAGVKRIYGVVGDSLNGLTEAIRKRKIIEWVTVRHEEVAAFAAGLRRILPVRWRSVLEVAVRVICT